jgi:pSer/pThr/pTyr-binding forkhead associated (FHA) protein
MLEDLGSTNGTMLDGVRVSQPQPLHRLHVINFGNVGDFFFQITKSPPLSKLDTHDEPVPVKIPTVIRKLGSLEPRDPQKRPAGGRRTQDQPLPVQMPNAVAQAVKGKPTVPTEYWLCVTNLEEKREYRLSQGVNVVGRSSKANIQIHSDEVSRRHAYLTLKGSILQVEDLGSTNGTFIDHRKVEGVQQLDSGKNIAFGKIEARIEERHPRSGP